MPALANVLVLSVVSFLRLVGFGLWLSSGAEGLNELPIGSLTQGKCALYFNKRPNEPQGQFKTISRGSRDVLGWESGMTKSGNPSGMKPVKGMAGGRLSRDSSGHGAG